MLNQYSIIYNFFTILHLNIKLFKTKKYNYDLDIFIKIKC